MTAKDKHKPTIFINGRFLTRCITGVERYTREVVSVLDSLIERDDTSVCGMAFEVLAPSGKLDPFSTTHIPIRQVGWLSGHAWEQLELPFYARGGLLLNPCNTGPVVMRNQIVTIHDAAVFALPNSYSRAFGAWYRLLLPALGKVARKVVTVSEFSKREIVRYCNTDPQKIQVIRLGVEQVFRPSPNHAVIERYRLTEQPFVLAVSSMSPSKNFAALIQALELLEHPNFKVVVAGGTNPKILRNSSGLNSDRITYLGRVTDGELRALYEKAACFIYPSLYEGFGLPPLEAMACGCPVIASNAASLPEVCGEAALYCDPNDPQDIANKIQRLLCDKELQDCLRTKGLERARQFSWEKCAREMLDVIEQVLRVGGTARHA